MAKPPRPRTKRGEDSHRARLGRARKFRKGGKGGKSGYAQVGPHEQIAFATAAGAVGVAVLTALRQYADSEGSSYPSKTSIAALAGVAPRTVPKVMETLEAAGLIERTFRGGLRTNIYRISEIGVRVYLADREIPIIRRVAVALGATEPVPAAHLKGCQWDTQTDHGELTKFLQVEEGSLGEALSSLPVADQIEEIARRFEGQGTRKPRAA